MTHPLPPFYDPAQVPQLYIERAALVAQAALDARRSGLAPASSDAPRVAAFGIDVQVGFCTPGASLFVPGAVQDTQRAVEWIYRNLPTLTTLFFSLDTHHAFQIFHPAFWADPDGNPPPPFTSITADDLRAGRWTPRAPLDLALDYCERLEASGRYVLTVWPYHTLLGGTSHALVPAMMEAALYHALARQAEPRIVTKGSHPLTESYSVLSPEVTQVGGQTVGHFQQDLFDALLSHDRVYVFGQASSHCVRATLLDLRDRILATDPKLLSRLYVLTDAMSPVTPPPLDPLPDSLNFPAIAAHTLRDLASQGVHLVTTLEDVEV